MNAASLQCVMGATRPGSPTGAPAIPRSTTTRPRARAPHRVLFLDFDGVLHPTSIGLGLDSNEVIRTGHFGWLPHLASVLRPHPDVVIVVHSTWRYNYDEDELRELLGAVGGRVVGATPRGPRYESITWWLQQNPSFASYRILDDEPVEFPDPLPAELVLCDPLRGVSSPEVLAALKDWLGRPCS